MCALRVRFLRGSLTADQISSELIDAIVSHMRIPVADVLAWMTDCVAAIRSLRQTRVRATPAGCHASERAQKRRWRHGAQPSRRRLARRRRGHHAQRGAGRRAIAGVVGAAARRLGQGRRHWLRRRGQGGSGVRVRWQGVAATPRPALGHA